MRKLLTLAVSALTLALACAGSAFAVGGPIVLAGIDAEDGAPFNGHGPIGNYQTLAGSVLANATNGGSGILGIGCGKNPGDNVTFFWNALASGNGTTITCVNGAAIGSVSFSGYKMIGIASDQFNTPGGGLTSFENGQLNARAADIAGFVNGGGGLLAFSNVALPGAYGWLGSIGSFSFGSVFDSNINPTAAGLAVGITNALDVCCWHDSYLTYPSFMTVLATYNNGAAAAIGGNQVVISTMALNPANATLDAGGSHCVTANLKDQLGNPLSGVTIYFSVTGANTTSGSAVTDASGNASFCYTGANAGDDTINAYADSDGDGVQDANEPFGVAGVKWEARNADLSVSKTAAALVQNGSNLAYTVTVSNAGPAGATGVTVTDTLPAGTTLVSAPGCTGTTTLTCAVGNLAAGASQSFTITVTVNTAAGSIKNTASASGDQNDPDAANNSDDAETAVNHAPSCATLAAAGPSMWPPNHKLRSFTISGGSDSDGDAVTLAITSVHQDEPVNGLGDGDTAPDAFITGATTVDLRAERAGGSNGRVYYIGVTVSDGRGGSCTGTVTVGVPHDQRPGAVAVGEGPLHSST